MILEDRVQLVKIILFRRTNGVAIFAEVEKELELFASNLLFMFVVVVDFAAGLGTSEQRFNTGTEVLNKQNMGFMRNGLQETANSKNSNPAISDRGIAQLINNVLLWFI
jgi:hypothetical protein